MNDKPLRYEIIKTHDSRWDFPYVVRVYRRGSIWSHINVCMTLRGARRWAKREIRKESMGRVVVETWVDDAADA